MHSDPFDFRSLSRRLRSGRMQGSLTVVNDFRLDLNAGPHKQRRSKDESHTQVSDTGILHRGEGAG